MIPRIATAAGFITYSLLLMTCCLMPLDHAIGQGNAAEIDLEALSHQAETIDMDTAVHFPLREQRVRNDSGINVLIDLAHRATFKTMWSWPRELRSNGMRAVGSQASLDTVLTPGAPCRVRVPIGDRQPFAWYPSPRFNLLITVPGSYQDYLDEERDAVDTFVKNGGGLVVLNSLNTPLLENYGVTVPENQTRQRGMPPVEVDANWETLKTPEKDGTFVARRTHGKGRILIASSDRFSPNENDPDDAIKRDEFIELLRWAASGSEPVGGTLCLPQERGGGGPIYPELEERFGPIVVYYAKNQMDVLIETVRSRLPEVRKQLFQWLPSVEPTDPMYIVLSAGSGGGWAVNAYEPKETGIISASPNGVISIFAHEQAHTMGGPPNAKGQMAADIPGGNRGEAHAGWFQGKINVLFNNGGEKNINGILAIEEKAGEKLDLAQMGNREYHDKWGKGKDWSKLWWIYATLDHRYGPTWYPRWKWVQYNRWIDQPSKRLNWDEIVEDMSIAVGEDLHPFFRKIGTSLQKERFPEDVFMGETIELPVAEITVGPAASTNVDPIGDYKKPLQAAQ